jgi:RNA polymerase sigma-70 factor (ECF subfamily)
MSTHYLSYDKILIDKLKNDDQVSFSIIFSSYYSDLVHFAFHFIRDLSVSEEIVQELFLKIWENRHYLEIGSSLKSYLLKSVQNRCIDYTRHNNIRQRYISSILENHFDSVRDTEEYLLHSELDEKLREALQKIPSDLAEPFTMSRLQGMNYEGIARKLGVSVRTVEVRIAKALLLLKKELKDFLT